MADGLSPHRLCVPRLPARHASDGKGAQRFMETFKGSNMRKLLFGLVFLAAPSVAQEANQITLKYDDGTGVSGELLSFEDGLFRIQSSVGVIAIGSDDVSCVGTACPPGTELEVVAAPVALTGIDGNYAISGDVIDFVNGEYVVATAIGELRIPASDVTCEGAGCVATAAPEPSAPINQEVVLVSGPTTVEGILLRVEDGAYIIEVDQVGQLRVDANTFECRGEACP